MAKNDPEIDAILEAHSSAVKSCVAKLRKLVGACAPDAEEKGMRGWKNITYKRNSIFCYIAPTTNGVNFGFYSGAQLSDPDKLLEGGGKKLRHVKIRGPMDFSEKALKQLVTEAYRNDGE